MEDNKNSSTSITDTFLNLFLKNFDLIVLFGFTIIIPQAVFSDFCFSRSFTKNANICIPILLLLGVTIVIYIFLRKIINIICLKIISHYNFSNEMFKKFWTAFITFAIAFPIIAMLFILNFFLFMVLIVT